MVGTANDLNISQAGYVQFDGTSVFTGGTIGASAGSTVSFESTGSNISLSVTDANGNTIVGELAGSTSPITGTLNSGFGISSFLNNTLGSNNSGFGYNSFQGLGITGGEGDNNAGFGAGCFANLLNGSNNSGLGTNVGENYTGAESSNALISNAGVEGESNQIRIGTQGVGDGQQSACAIAGITGSTITAGAPVYIDSSGNLGTIGGIPVITSGNLVLIQSQTVSSSTPSLQFTSGMTVYNDYVLKFTGVTVDTNSINLNLQFSTDGGSSYSTSGYSEGGFLALNVNLNPIGYTTNPGFSLADNLKASTFPICISGNINLYDLGNSTYNKNMNRFSICPRVSTVGQSYISTGGIWVTSTAVNALQIIPFSGNILTGTFKLYGIVD